MAVAYAPSRPRARESSPPTWCAGGDPDADPINSAAGPGRPAAPTALDAAVSDSASGGTSTLPSPSSLPPSNGAGRRGNSTGSGGAAGSNIVRLAVLTGLCAESARAAAAAAAADAPVAGVVIYIAPREATVIALLRIALLRWLGPLILAEDGGSEEEDGGREMPPSPTPPPATVAESPLKVRRLAPMLLSRRRADPPPLVVLPCSSTEIRVAPPPPSTETERPRRADEKSRSSRAGWRAEN